jgi:5-methyltetrahydrofolate--homocysteine methyltransferase
VPIQTSVSLLPNGGKMLLGTTSRPVLTTLTALDVDVIGLNCSTGPEDMRDAIRYLARTARCRCTASRTPACRSRAPTARRSSREPDPLANVLQEFVERYGVSIVGGCCGTTPTTSRDRGPRRRPRGAAAPGRARRSSPR